MTGRTITIDGPAGVGKTTVAKLLAQRLGVACLNSGLLYRAIAWKVHQRHIDPRDVEAVDAVCRQTFITLRWHDGDQILSVDGREVRDELRTLEVDVMASEIATHPCVREYLLPFQRNHGRHEGIVVEGRDMGTRVYPNADVKFFLDASLEQRAKRRFGECYVPAWPHSLAATVSGIAGRDARDSTRTTAPLRPAHDAAVIDTTSLTAEHVTDVLLQLIGERWERPRSPTHREVA